MKRGDMSKTGSTVERDDLLAADDVCRVWPSPQASVEPLARPRIAATGEGQGEPTALLGVPVVVDRSVELRQESLRNAIRGPRFYQQAHEPRRAIPFALRVVRLI